MDSADSISNENILACIKNKPKLSKFMLSYNIFEEAKSENSYFSLMKANYKPIVEKFCQ